MNALSHPSHASTTTVAWSPDGEHLQRGPLPKPLLETGQLVATGSSSDPNIVIWDVGTEVPTTIKATPAGITELKWSPSGNYLFAATT